MRSILVLFAAVSLGACTCGRSDATGARATIEVDPQSVDFGTTAPGVTVERTVAVLNQGRAALTIHQASLSGVQSGEFGLTFAAPSVLQPGQTLELTVRYVPGAAGAHAARVILESDASNTAELTVPLSGVARSLDLCDGVQCLSPPNPCHREGGTCAEGACSYLPKDDGTPCDDGDGCTQADACVSGSCRGTSISCTQAPPSTCLNAQTVQVALTPGTCSNGACDYQLETRPCANGCQGGLCQGDPCAGVTCTARPCFLPGVCVTGVCDYQADVGASCDDGVACTDNDACGATGACIGAPRSCSTPPPPTCVDASTQRTFSPMGTCSAGTCSYSPSDLSCALGCDSVTGRCRSTCPSGQHLCAGQCVSDTSVATCGASCTPCPVPSHGSATCTAGICGFTCTLPHVASGNSCTTWQEKAFLKASNAAANDAFGWYTAISGDGNVLVVVANLEDSAARGVGGDQLSNAAGDSGAAYVFRRTNGVWAQEAYLKTSNAEAADRLSGVTMSADGTAILLGAWGESSSATGMNGSQSSNAAADSGAAYLFRYASGSWSQEAYFKSSNTAPDDRFGTGMGINADGTVVAIGARNEDSSAVGIGGSQSSNAAVDSGAVYVFRKSAGTWAQEAYLKQSNTGAGDQFGLRVDLSNDGSVLVVGAWAEDSNGVGVNGVQSNNSSTDSGAVYVYRHGGSGWAQEAFLKASNRDASDWFGMAVAISGDGTAIAVGARNEASSALGVGANQSDNSAPGAGAVYLFRWSGTAWAQESYVKADNAGAGDYFGFTVGLSLTGDVLAVGAYREAGAARVVNGDGTTNSRSEAGAAYIFRRAAGAWAQEAYLKASNADASDWLGWNLSLSDDGNTVAVAAYGEDSNATGVGPASTDNSAVGSGAVYLF